MNRRTFIESVAGLFGLALLPPGAADPVVPGLDEEAFSAALKALYPPDAVKHLALGGSCFSSVLDRQIDRDISAQRRNVRAVSEWCADCLEPKGDHCRDCVVNWRPYR